MADEDDNKKKQGMGGLFNQISELLNAVSELQEGNEMNRTGQFRGRSGKVAGTYGFRVRKGVGGEEEDSEEQSFTAPPRRRPSSSYSRGGSGSRYGSSSEEETNEYGGGSGRVVAGEEREPVIDIFEEENNITVVAEMPGINPDTIETEVQDGNKLILKASNDERKYRKELKLSRQVEEKPLKRTYLNGIFSLVLACKSADSQPEE